MPRRAAPRPPSTPRAAAHRPPPTRSPRPSPKRGRRCATRRPRSSTRSARRSKPRRATCARIRRAPRSASPPRVRSWPASSRSPATQAATIRSRTESSARRAFGCAAPCRRRRHNACRLAASPPKEQRMSHHIPPNPRVPFLPVCVGIALLVAASSASAQATGDAPTSTTSSMQSTAKLSPADKTFVQKAAIGGLAEVEMGKLAQQKAASDQVKQFGTRMVDDHSKANDALKQVASSKGIALPSDLDAKQKSKMAKLEKLSGAQFDRAYMDDMVAD